jgi:hypothetical protein
VVDRHYHVKKNDRYAPNYHRAENDVFRTHMTHPVLGGYCDLSSSTKAELSRMKQNDERIRSLAANWRSFSGERRAKMAATCSGASPGLLRLL